MPFSVTVRLKSRLDKFTLNDFTHCLLSLSPERFPLRACRDMVDGQVGTVVFLFGIETDADGFLQPAIDRKTASQGNRDAQSGTDQLAHEAYTAHTAQCLCPEDTGGNAAPGTAQAMQRPDAEYVVDLPAVLGDGEHRDEQAAGHAAGNERTERVHQVGTGADGDEAGERAVMREAWVVLAHDEGDEGTADHRH